MGTLMCIGLTTANSILVVTFANQRMAAGDDAADAPRRRAGYTRLRPVLMTAGAMILGMVPMALGVGEGGEQNAPLARAVIGGLLFATFATLYSCRPCTVCCVVPLPTRPPRLNGAKMQPPETDPTGAATPVAPPGRDTEYAAADPGVEAHRETTAVDAAYGRAPEAEPEGGGRVPVARLCRRSRRPLL